MHPKEEFWPFFPTHDVEPDSVCTHCLQPCKEENLEAFVDVAGAQQYVCEDCFKELSDDFI